MCLSSKYYTLIVKLRNAFSLNEYIYFFVIITKFLNKCFINLEYTNYIYNTSCEIWCQNFYLFLVMDFNLSIQLCYESKILKSLVILWNAN